MTRILLLTICSIFFISCSSKKNEEPNKEEIEAGKSDVKGYITDVLQGYTDVDENKLAAIKQSRIAFGDTEDSVDQDIALVDSVVTIAHHFVEQENLCALMNLLDDNLMNFYSHPSNDALYLMGELNYMLKALYRVCLDEDVQLQKYIRIQAMRKLFLEGVIGFKGENYLAKQQEYDSAYVEVISDLKELYLALGEHTEELKELEELLMAFEEE